MDIRQIFSTNIVQALGAANSPTLANPFATIADIGGGGTVTSVAWTTSQGVSASISNPTTTPNITITLGALTSVTSFNGFLIGVVANTIDTGTAAALNFGTSNATQFNFGTGGTASADPYVNILRTVSQSTNGNAHGFTDASIFIKTNAALAYNAFDAMYTVGGGAADAVNYNHTVPFQDAAIWNGAGTLTTWYTIYSHPTFNRGTITNRYGAYVDSWIQGGTAVVTNDYGVYVNTLSGGTLNYAFYHNGTSPSVMGGAVSGTSFSSNGASGAGYFELAPQSSAPSSPASNFLRMYSTSGNLSIKNNAAQVLQFAFPASSSYTYTLPASTTTILGQTGTGAADYVAFYGDATQVTSSSAFQWNTSNVKLSLGTGAITNTLGHLVIGGASTYVNSITSTGTVVGNYGATLQNTSSADGAGVTLIMNQSTNNYCQITRKSSGSTGNVGNSNITAADCLNFDNSNDGNTGTSKYYFRGNFYAQAGTAGANLAIGVAAAGIRISAASTIATAPTAYLHIATAGTATANTAPIQIANGTRETTARGGLLEYENNWYLTNNSLIRFGVGGAIKDFITDVGTGANTTETDIYTYTTPANTLAVNGDTIQAEYGIQFANNTQTKEVKVYFAGTVIFDTGALTISAASEIAIYVTIIRDTSTTVRYTVSAATTGASTAAYSSVGKLTGLTLSGTNIIKCTGQSGGITPLANDVLGIMGKVYIQAAA